jgi:hypothetical protein
MVIAGTLAETTTGTDVATIAILVVKVLSPTVE